MYVYMVSLHSRDVVVASAVIMIVLRFVEEAMAEALFSHPNPLPTDFVSAERGTNVLTLTEV